VAQFVTSLQTVQLSATNPVIIELQDLSNEYGFILSFIYKRYLSCYIDRPGFIPTSPGTTNTTGTNLVQQIGFFPFTVTCSWQQLHANFVTVCFTVYPYRDVTEVKKRVLYRWWNSNAHLIKQLVNYGRLY
jgi:hypothetical protein